MGWLRRHRDLGLRPLSELHDEFAARPGAQSKLDDAEAELTKSEHAPHAQHGSEGCCRYPSWPWRPSP